MSKWLNKVLYGSLVALLVACSYLYISNSNKEKDLIRIGNQVTRLEEDLKTHKQRLEEAKILRDELDEVIQNTRKSLDNLEGSRAETIRQIEEIKNRGSNSGEQKKQSGQSSIGDSLNPDLIGVLSDLCERVRGSPCPDP